MIKRKFKIKNILSVNKKAALFLLAAVFGFGIQFSSAQHASAVDLITIQTKQTPGNTPQYSTYTLTAMISGVPGGPKDTNGNSQYSFTWLMIDSNGPSIIPIATSNTDLEKIILSDPNDSIQSSVQINLSNSKTYEISVQGQDVNGAKVTATPITITGQNAPAGSSANSNSALTFCSILQNFSGGGQGGGATNILEVYALYNGQAVLDQSQSGNAVNCSSNVLDPQNLAPVQTLILNPGDTLTWYSIDSNGNKSKLSDGNPYSTVRTFFTSQTIEADLVMGGKTYTGQVSTNSATSYTNGPAGGTAGAVNPILTFLKDIIGGLVFFLSTVLYEIIRLIFTPLIMTVLSIAPHTPSFSAVILTVWVFVRNVVNILFILALIALGLATLLRVDNDHLNYKHLIPNLVMMAILVNFSLVIAQLILGVADTVQAQFLPNNADVINNLARELLLQPVINNFSGVLSPGTWTEIISSLIYLLFGMGAFIAFGLIAAFLVLRIVGLWLLLMLSPVAYAANVLPWTHDIAHEWWHKFLAYSFFTPILAFFLHACAVLVVAQASFIGSVTQTTVSLSSTANHAQFIYNILSGTLVLICLYAGLMVSQKFHIAGAHWVVEQVEHGVHAGAHRLGSAAVKWKDEKVTEPLLDRGIRTKGTAGVFFRTLARATAPVKGWGARGERVHHEQEKVTQRVAGKFAVGSEFGATKGEIDLARDVDVLRNQGAEYAKIWRDYDSQRLSEQWQKLAGVEGHDAEKLGLMMAMFNSGRTKDALTNVLGDAEAGKLVDGHGHPIDLKPEGMSDEEWNANKDAANMVTFQAFAHKLFGRGNNARMIKSEIVSQMAKSAGLNWAIYPGAPDGNGGFQDGDELLPPDKWNQLKKEIGITDDMEKDDKGIKVAPITVTRGAGEYALRGHQTEDANDLIKTGMHKPTFQDSQHFSIDYLSDLSRISSASPDTLLRASPQFYEETLGVIGHTAGGALVFKNDKFQKAFEHGMTKVNDAGQRTIRPEYETMWQMMFNRVNGIVRPQEATQTGGTYIAFNDDGTYGAKAVTKPREPMGEVSFSSGGKKMEIPPESGRVDISNGAEKGHKQLVEKLIQDKNLQPNGALASNPITEELYKKGSGIKSSKT